MKKFFVLTMIFAFRLYANASETFYYEVSANNNFQTGLYLKKGVHVVIRADGRWRMGRLPGYKTWVGIRGNYDWVPHPYNQPNGCLVASVGEKKYFPDGNEIDFYVESNGSLSLGPNDGDLSDNEGSLSVEVNIIADNQSILDTRLSISDEDFEQKALKIKAFQDDIPVLLVGKYTGHIIKVKWLKQIKNLRGFILWFDKLYQTQYDLAGKRPFGGARVFYKSVKNFNDFHDGSIFMLSGNPIRYRQDATKYLVKIPEDTSDAWGFIHEMGHNFSFILDNGYMDQGLVEVGANIFTLYTWEKLGLSNVGHYKHYMEYTKKWWKTGKNNDELIKSSWYLLGLLMSIKDDYGWHSFKYLYRSAWKIYPYQIRNWRERFDFWCLMLSLGSGVNLVDRFNSWGCNISERVGSELSDLKKDDKWKKWIDYFNG